MKSDADVWISRSTKASRPDELGPDEAAGCLSLGRSRQGREEGGEPAPPNVTPAGGPAGLHTLAIQGEMGSPSAGSAGRLLDLPHVTWQPTVPRPATMSCVFPGRACVSGITRRTWCG